jgi:hypothetical protein
MPQAIHRFDSLGHSIQSLKVAPKIAQKGSLFYKNLGPKDAVYWTPV